MTAKGKRRKKNRFGCFTYLILLATLGGMAFAAVLFGRQILDCWVDDHIFDAQIRNAALKYNVDSRLIRAVIFEESRFNPSVVGQAGEIGLMQLLPSGAVLDWAKEKKETPPSKLLLFSPSLNIEIGTWYLSRGLKRYRDYKDAISLALCYYNAGVSRSDAWKPESPDGELLERIQIKSTYRYVSNIMDRYRDYCSEDAE